MNSFNNAIVPYFIYLFENLSTFEVQMLIKKISFNRVIFLNFHKRATTGQHYI